MILFTGNSESWNELVVSVPLAHVPQQSHYMQSWQWSQAKARSGWIPIPLVWDDGLGNIVAAAMVLKRPLPIKRLAEKICVLYIPRGPILNWEDVRLRSQVLQDLEELAQKQGAIYVKVDPDISLGTGAPGEEGEEFPVGHQACSDLKTHGWHYSKERVLILHTILIDLTASEDKILARMKQKTRYNIRLAQKKGVVVRQGTVEDYPSIFSMLKETAERDHFEIRDEGHYRFMWESLGEVPGSPQNLQPFVENLIAEVSGEVIAAVSLFIWGDHATYLYGMSQRSHKDKMPNYLLQWEAMRRAKALGCVVYDTYGISDTFREGSKLWNVYRFKDGFGGTVYRGIGAWDFTPWPILYHIYLDVLPIVNRILGIHGPPYTSQAERI